MHYSVLVCLIAVLTKDMLMNHFENQLLNMLEKCMKAYFLYLCCMMLAFGQVEKGSAVYLSGLREKYFGEIFLNASTSLGVLLPSEVSSSSFSNLEAHSFVPFQMDKIIIEENIESESLDDTSFHGNTTSSIAYEEGLSHIARYVESFESRSNEIWLVFRHEGISLTKLMYTTGDADEISSERAGHAQVLRPSKWWHWLKTTKAGEGEMRSLIRQLVRVLMFHITKLL